jgi:hypothetical protein
MTTLDSDVISEFLLPSKERKYVTSKRTCREMLLHVQVELVYLYKYGEQTEQLK